MLQSAWVVIHNFFWKMLRNTSHTSTQSQHTQLIVIKPEEQRPPNPSVATSYNDDSSTGVSLSAASDIDDDKLFYDEQKRCNEVVGGTHYKG